MAPTTFWLSVKNWPQVTFRIFIQYLAMYIYLLKNIRQNNKITKFTQINRNIKYLFLLIFFDKNVIIQI